MKRYLVGALLALLSFSASAQQILTPTAGGGGTPGGSNTQLQYNNSSAFGGISAWTSDGTNLTGTRKLVITQGTVNESVLTSTGYSLTGTDTTAMVSLAGTWNTSGNATVLSVAITNTASNGQSKLFNFLGGAAGATSELSLTATGLLAGANDWSTAGAITAGAGASRVDLSSNGSSGAVFLGSDTFVRRRAAASLMLGLADAAAPVAQTLSVQSVVAGTASGTVGQDWTFNGSQGTGTGIGGSLVFKTAPAHGADTVQGTLTTAMVIDSTGAVKISKGFTVGTLPTAGTAGRRAYVTDQLTTCAALGVAPTGGGAKVCPVFDDGAAWVGG